MGAEQSKPDLDELYGKGHDRTKIRYNTETPDPNEFGKPIYTGKGVDETQYIADKLNQNIQKGQSPDQQTLNEMHDQELSKIVASEVLRTDEDDPRRIEYIDGKEPKEVQAVMDGSRHESVKIENYTKDYIKRTPTVSYENPENSEDNSSSAS